MINYETSLRKQRKCQFLLSRSSYPQQQTPCTVSPSATGTTFVTQQTRGKNPTHTHHPHNIVKNLKKFQAAEIFAQPLLISYKRDKNLSNFLVKSTLKSDHRAYDVGLVLSSPTRNLPWTGSVLLALLPRPRYLSIRFS